MIMNTDQLVQDFQIELRDALGRRDLGAIETLLLKYGNDNGSQLSPWLAHGQAILATLNSNHDAAITTWLELLDGSVQIDRSLLPRVCNGIGLSNLRLQRLDIAQGFLQKSISAYEDIGDSVGALGVKSNMLGVHYRATEYAECVSLCLTINDLLTKIDLDDHRINQIKINSLGHAGLAFTKIGDFERAIIFLNEGLSLAEILGSEVLQASMLENLGDAWFIANEFDRALNCYQSALDLSLRARWKDQIPYLYFLIGSVHQAKGGSIDTVWQYFDIALDKSRTDDRLRSLFPILLACADLLDEEHKHDLALELTREAVQQEERIRASLVLPTDRERISSARADVYEHLVKRLLSIKIETGLPEGFYNLELAKSRGLNELLAHRPLRRSRAVPEELLQLQFQSRFELSELYRSGSFERSTDIVMLKERELSELRERIRLMDAEFSSFDTVDPLPLETVQQRLPDNALLLEFFTIEDRILLFIIKKHSVNHLYLDISLSKIEHAFHSPGENQVGGIRGIGRDRHDRLSQDWMLQKLYRALIEPVEADVEQAEILCIVPHSILHYVPFHALYRKTVFGKMHLHGTYQEPKAVLYAPSATTLFEYSQMKPSSPNQGSLAIGHNGSLLTHAEPEAAAVVEHTGGRVLNGPDATRESVIEQGKNYRYLHLSCHGWFNPTWPLLSSLDLADGTLDVNDIFLELELNAELVTLSACETGKARVLKGDELIGLARAFLYAGTPSVLVSHWTVDEVSTRLLMTRFYQELEAAQDIFPIARTAYALSKAQAWLRELSTAELRGLLQAATGSSEEVDQILAFLAYTAGLGDLASLSDDARLLTHPYYWAPFTLIGDRLIQNPA
jgi:CHAT domain-containing protein/tetratricopeptide (TPR) repeat protein